MTILVATDFSENSRAALHLGARLARAQNRALTLMHVVDLAASDNAWRVLVETPQDIEESAQIEAREKLEEFYTKNLDEDERPKAVRFEVANGNPIEELLRTAKTLPNPTIVAGTRGGSRLQEFFLGSTAHRLVRQSDHPVVLATPLSGRKDIKTIVAGLDFSPSGREVLKKTAELARQHKATVHVVHGFVIPEVTALQASMAAVATDLDELNREKRKHLLEMVQEVGADDVVELVEVRQMPPALAVISMAEDNDADMIALGTHGRRGFSRFFLGNTAERLMRRAPCPLFVVRAVDEPE